MKPPRNAEEDRQALVEALEDGTLDCIATDHAPHTATSKNTVFDAAPFGIIGMETAFPVCYTEFVATGKWGLDFLISRLTSGPAGVMGEQWGTLAPGCDADFVLLDLGNDYVFTKDHLGSKSTNCPWQGQTMKGRIAATFVGGEPVFVQKEVYPRSLSSKPSPKKMKAEKVPVPTPKPEAKLPKPKATKAKTAKKKTTRKKKP
jgi:dihydroorotase